MNFHKLRPWCETADKKWGYCIPFKTPTPSMSDKLLIAPENAVCSEIAKFTRVECGEDLTQADCENEGCCFLDDGKSPACFHKSKLKKKCSLSIYLLIFAFDLQKMNVEAKLIFQQKLHHLIIHSTMVKI